MEKNMTKDIFFRIAIFIIVAAFFILIVAMFAIATYAQNDTNSTNSTECQSVSLVCDGGYTYDISGCIVGCLNQSAAPTTTTTVPSDSDPDFFSNLLGQILGFFGWLRSLIPL